MSPLKIKIALHYFWSPQDYPDRTSQADIDAFADFMNEGLLTKRCESQVMQAGTSEYQATEKLKAYCNALTRVPLPVEKWVIPAFDLNGPHRPEA